MKIASKNLKKTDIEKRLTIPSKSLNYFPPLSDKHMMDFPVRDESGHVWKFRIYTRKKNNKELRIGDRVAFYMDKDQAGTVRYRIEVIERATQRSSILSPQNHNADRTMVVASCSNVEEEPTIISHILDQTSYSNIEEDSTITSHSTDRARTYDQTEGLHNQPVTDKVGLKFEFIKPHIKVRETEFIDFFELGSQERREKEQPSFPTLHRMVEKDRESKFIDFLEFGSQERTEKEQPSFPDTAKFDGSLL
ncbi:hypothetical protein CRYUN_Cryun18bG0136500 [Craigia yunnanensis]